MLYLSRVLAGWRERPGKWWVAKVRQQRKSFLSIPSFIYSISSKCCSEILSYCCYPSSHLFHPLPWKLTLRSFQDLVSISIIATCHSKMILVESLPESWTDPRALVRGISHLINSIPPSLLIHWLKLWPLKENGARFENENLGEI